jgi:putative AlgH/UPF0301 family transcriptional regulator
MDEENEGPDDLEPVDDWRSFRARLVSMENYETHEEEEGEEKGEYSDWIGVDQDKHEKVPSRKKRQSWAFESGTMLEQGTVILHRPPDPSIDFGYSLGRQYFHKAVILVLEVDDEYNHNIVTKGCILNRPTNLILDDFNGTESFHWKVFFGGDEFGLHTDHPKFYCLHSLTFYEALEVSRPVIPNIFFTSIQNAKELVYSGLATPDDFWTFCGFISWEPNELRQDVVDNVWYAVSTDSFTLQKGLRILSAGRGLDPREAGIRTWSMLMDRIGKHDEVDDECSMESVYCDYSFDDLMLREWAYKNLIFEHPPAFVQGSEDDIVKFKLKHNPPPLVSPGSIVRGSSAQRSPFLLQSQEFHKSTILIIQDNHELTVGVILNHPSSTCIENNDPLNFDIPLRFGGFLSFPSAEDKEPTSSMLILHMNPSPSKGRISIGQSIGSSKFSICSKDEASKAISSGYALASEFMFINGFCVWPKAVVDQGHITGGIGEEIANGRFELVSENIERMWQYLLKQQTLSDVTLNDNLYLSNLAWTAAGGAKATVPTNLELLHRTDISASNFSDAALKTWVLAFLLNDPSNRP